MHPVPPSRFKDLPDNKGENEVEFIKAGEMATRSAEPVIIAERMQLKVNFLCKDSILAAPLAIEIARCLDLAQRKGQGGVVEEMGCFFKAPATQDGRPPLHAFPEQQRILVEWLEATSGKADVEPATETTHAEVPVLSEATA